MAMQSDVIEKLFLTVSDDTSKEVMTRLLRDKTTATYNLIDQTCTDIIKTKLHKSTGEKFEIIHTKLEPKHQKMFEDTYPEFKFKFTGDVSVGHPFLNVSRYLETQLLLNKFIKINNAKKILKNLEYYNDYVTDVGGNAINNIIKEIYGIHSCEPILSNYDSYRKTNRLEKFIHLNVDSDFKAGAIKSLLTDENVMCRNKVQNCKRKSIYMMAIHSVYDIDIVDLVNAMDNKETLILYGTFMFNPNILLNNQGHLPDIDIQYTIKGNKITFVHLNDTSFGYSHDLSNYLKYVTIPVVYSKNGICYIKELLFNRNDIQYFKISKIENSPRNDIFYGITFPEWQNKTRLLYFDWFYAGLDNQNVRLTLKPKSLLIDTNFFNDVCNYAFGLSDTKFQPSVIYDYAKSTSSRVVHDAKNVKEFKFKDPDYLYSLSFAIYMYTYQKKWEHGKIIQSLISEQKTLREGVNLSIFQKFVYHVRKFFNIGLPKPKAHAFKIPYEDLILLFQNDIIKVTKNDVEFVRVYNDVIGKKNFFKRNDVINQRYYLPKYDEYSVLDKIDNEISNVCDLIFNEADGVIKKVLNSAEISSQPINKYVGAGGSSEFHLGNNVPCTLSKHDVIKNNADGCCLYYSLLASDNKDLVDELTKHMLDQDTSYLPSTEKEDLINTLMEKKPGGTPVIEHYCHTYDAYVILHLLNDHGCNAIGFGDRTTAKELIHLLYTKNVLDEYGIGHYERIVLEAPKELCLNPTKILDRLTTTPKEIVRNKSVNYSISVSKIFSLGFNFFKLQSNIFEYLDELDFFSKTLHNIKPLLSKGFKISGLNGKSLQLNEKFFIGLPQEIENIPNDFLTVIDDKDVAQLDQEVCDTNHKATAFKVDDVTHIFFKHTGKSTRINLKEIFSECKSILSKTMDNMNLLYKTLCGDLKIIRSVESFHVVNGVGLELIQTIYRLKASRLMNKTLYYYDPHKSKGPNYQFSLGSWRPLNVKLIYNLCEIPKEMKDVLIVFDHSLKRNSKDYILETILSSGLRNMSVFFLDKRQRLNFVEYVSSLNLNENYSQEFDKGFDRMLFSIESVISKLSILSTENFAKLKTDMLPDVKNRGYAKLQEIFCNKSVTCERFLELGANPGGMTRCILEYFKNSTGVAHLYYGPGAIAYENKFRNVFVIPENKSVGYDGDLTKMQQVDYLINAVNGYFDMIVADCCSLRGVDDNVKNFELLHNQIHIMKSKLKYGGTFILKVFLREEVRTILCDLSKYFHVMSYMKPKTANPLNNEIYCVMSNKRVHSMKSISYFDIDNSCDHYSNVSKRIDMVLRELNDKTCSNVIDNINIDLLNDDDDELFNVDDLESLTNRTEYKSTFSTLDNVFLEKPNQDDENIIKNNHNNDTLNLRSPAVVDNLNSEEIIERLETKNIEKNLKTIKSFDGQMQTLISKLTLEDRDALVMISQNIERDLLNKEKVDLCILELIDILHKHLDESFMDKYLTYEHISNFIKYVLQNPSKSVEFIDLDSNTRIEQWGKLKCVTKKLKKLTSDQLPEDVGGILQNWNRSSAKSKYDPYFESRDDDELIVVRNSIREIKEIWRITPDILVDQYCMLYNGFRLNNDDDISYPTKRRILLEKKNLGLIDIKLGNYIIKPAQSKATHEYVFNGKEFTKLEKNLKAKMHVSRYGLVSDDMEVMNERLLYGSTKHLNYFSFVKPKIDNIQGVPGCGKTTYIISNSNPNDLLLAATRDGVVGLKLKSNNKHKFIYTIHSFLINVNDMIFDHVWIDEALKEHFGTLNLIILKTRCKHLHIIGDNKQIPYFNKVTSVVVLFSDITKHIKCTSYLNKSYRVPVDVAYSLSKYYDKGFFTCNEIYESMRVEQIKNQLDIPKTFDPNNTKIVVFKKSEKQLLISHGFIDVSTVGEYQGRQIENVRLVRLSNAERDEIYSRQDQIIVALSRHTKSLVYYTLRIDDSISKLITNIPDRSTLREAYFKKENRFLGAGVCYDIPEMHQMLTKKILYTQSGNIQSIVDLNYGDKYAPIKLKKTTTICHLPYQKKCASLRIADISFLQMFYDYVLPGNSCIDYKHDQYHAEKLPFEFSHSNVIVDLCKFDVNIDKFDKLKPNIRTSIAYPRKLNQLDALIGLNKRNLNIPELDEVVEEDYIIELSVELFMKTYVTNFKYFEQFSCAVNQVYPSESLIEEWFHDQPESVKLQINEIMTLETMNLSSYSLMNKKNIKPGLTLEAPYEYSAVQTIASQSKTHNMIFCPIFRELKRRLLSTLKPNFQMFTDMSPDEFADKLSHRFPLHILNTLEKLEVDIGKYDKSQYRLLFEIEIKIYRMLGMPEIFIRYWRKAHEYTTLKDRLHGVRCDLLYQRKSGDASTFFGNTLVLMVVLCVLFDLSDAYGVFSGDDSILWLPEIIDRNDLCANIFNLESKFYKYSYSYFCSKYLLEIDNRFRFIPDPLKVLTKLGRHDLVNWEHLEEYRISLCDLMKEYDDASIYDSLSKAMSERHCKPIEIGLLLSTIYGIVHDKELFKSLYYVNDDDILLSDPSRPNLDI